MESDQLLVDLKRRRAADKDWTESMRVVRSDRSGENRFDLAVERMYHISHIRDLCTVYRLRFLDAKVYRRPVPEEAYEHLQSIGAHSLDEQVSFKILAPAEAFHLTYGDKDPMLFMPIGDGVYYLVHKWGGEINRWRKWMVYPVRSFSTFLKVLFVAAFLFQWLIPSEVMLGGMMGNITTLRIWMTFHVFIAFLGVSAMFLYPALKNFNGALWDCPHKD